MSVLAAVLVSVDFLLWILTLGPIWMLIAASKRKSTTSLGDRAVQAGTHDVNGAGQAPSRIIRNPRYSKSLYTFPSADIQTCWDMMNYAHKAFASSPSLGTRNILRIDTTLHPKFPTKIFGETEWMSFAEVGETAQAFGRGLKGLGMTSLNMAATDKFDAQAGPFTILLWENSCKEWMMAMQGAFSQSIVVSTCYATLGVDAVFEAVNEGAMPTVLCNKKDVKRLAEMATSGKMPTLKNIIYTYDSCLPEDRQTRVENNFSGLNIISFEELVEKGKASKVDVTPPQPHDVAILMYTSGSTGKPKGVVIKHSNMVAAGGSLLEQAQVQRGSYCAFLPLAHILEMGLEMGFFYNGSTIGYADPKVLAAGPGKCMPTGALECFKPTFMAGVPKVWEGFKAAGDAKTSAMKGAKKTIFDAAFAAKKAAIPAGRYCPLFDMLVFNKFKGIVGGSLQIAVSGGGAISSEVQEWIRVCIGCPMVQGYGLTETCLGLTLQSDDDFRLGIVGAPIGSVEYLLHSEPDVCDASGKPYLASDTDSMGSPCLGRGEVWVRGPNISSGYYKMPKETAEVYRSDGFFQTGDIGMTLPDGSIKIIDRKKNLVKLKGGEYIALEKMNNAFNNSIYVSKENGGSCAYGDGDLDRPVALIQANEVTIMELAKELGVSGSFEEVSQNEKVNKAVLDDLNRCGKAAAFSVLEAIAGVALLTVPWCPENKTMTATFKLTPSVIKIVNKKELDIVKKKGIR